MSYVFPSGVWNFETELVAFKEVSNIEIAGKVFPAEMRKNHSIVMAIADGDGNFLINDSEFTTEDIRSAGLTPRLVLWESGGGYSNTGSAQIVCGLKGQKLIPIYICRRGSLACSRHAKFVVYPRQGMVVVYVSHHRKDFIVRIDKVSFTESFLVDVERLWYGKELDKSNIEDQIPTKLDRYLDAVKAAMNKATCYHCREPHYILDEES